MTNASPLLIFGPTASGKSALAITLAERDNGQIINADSMQVYAELDILSARPSRADEARVPHSLYGFVPAQQAYSVGRYVLDAARAIDEAVQVGRRPIIVGGTGLYFKALLEGLSPIPAVDEEVRAHWRQMAEIHGANALWQILSERDPQMALRLDPNDAQRIVRALEVIDSSGKSLAEWQSQRGSPVIEQALCEKLILMPDRETLHAKAEARFDAMMAAGALDEAKRLSDLNLDPGLPASRALGVAPLIAAVRGEVTIVDAVSRAKAETRQYIKRQTTWANGNMMSWTNI